MTYQGVQRSKTRSLWCTTNAWHEPHKRPFPHSPNTWNTQTKTHRNAKSTEDGCNSGRKSLQPYVRSLRGKHEFDEDHTRWRMECRLGITTVHLLRNSTYKKNMCIFDILQIYIGTRRHACIKETGFIEKCTVLMTNIDWKHNHRCLVIKAGLENQNDQNPVVCRSKLGAKLHKELARMNE